MSYQLSAFTIIVREAKRSGITFELSTILREKVAEMFDVRDVGAAVMVMDTHGNGAHAEGLGSSQVAGVVVNQQAIFGDFIDESQAFVESFDFRFAMGINGVNIDDLVEVVLDAQDLHHPVGMRRVGVGEDHLALGKGV